MNSKQATKQAAKASKTEGTQYVVWVFDQGREVFNGTQLKTYEAFCSVEAVFVAGVEVANQVAA